MSKQALTLVTVTKDDPSGLARTLTSCAGLRRAGVQHLVVDGGADRDGTANLAAAADGDVTVVYQQSRGIAAAFNEGLAHAQGEWIWFLNGGDAIHDDLDPSWLLSLLSRTRAQVITGALQFDGEPVARSKPHLSYQWPLISCWLAHPATLVRRERLLAVGGFDPRWRIAMDYDLWLRLLQPDVTVDVLSVPFARFDVTGVSERPETRAAARREEMRIVVKHGWRLVWAGPWLCLRLARRLGQGLLGAWRQ